MKKWKKILIGIVIFEIVCSVGYYCMYTTRSNPINEYFLEKFRNSEILKEKYGEITKVKIDFIKSFKTISYDEDKYIEEYTIYTSDGSKHNLQVVYKDVEGFYGYLIDGELVYEKDSNYLKTTILKSDEVSTEILVKYNGNLYGKAYSVIDYAGNPDGPVGVIDKLTDKENIPKYDCETNTEEILNANVDSSSEDAVVLQYNNEYVLFKKIDY